MGPVSPGFFGKTPSRGDFVSRRLSTGFVSHWDGWLQSALAVSQGSLGSGWLDVYLTSPIWRFALAPGVCGDEAHLGIVVPSVDKVGRYFPMAVVLPCGEAPTPVELAAGLDDWYLDAENLLLATLAETPLSLEAFDDGLIGLAVSSDASVASPPWSLGDGISSVSWHCEASDTHPIRESVLPLFHSLQSRVGRQHSVWWTQGSERVEPSVLITSGLPEPAQYIAMLDGRWAERGWSSGTPDRSPEGPVRARGVRCRSAAVTDPGKARNVNEDSFALRDDHAVWIVADGMGGHQAGDIASRMVTSVLDQIGEEVSLDGRVDRFVHSLSVVNGCLRVLAQRHADITLAGSTVVALMIEGNTSVCVWAGDSRLYRFREGVLQQLSRDHSDGEEGGDHVITRAVGGTDDLQLDVEHADVRAGDRYLLCTDGLYGELAFAELAAALSLPEPEQACEQLQRAALQGEARDNLTAVVVHVSAAPAAAGSF